MSKSFYERLSNPKANPQKKSTSSPDTISQSSGDVSDSNPGYNFTNFKTTKKTQISLCYQTFILFLIATYRNELFCSDKDDILINAQSVKFSVKNHEGKVKEVYLQLNESVNIPRKIDLSILSDSERIKRKIIIIFTLLDNSIEKVELELYIHPIVKNETSLTYFLTTISDWTEFFIVVKIKDPNYAKTTEDEDKFLERSIAKGKHYKSLYDLESVNCSEALTTFFASSGIIFRITEDKNWVFDIETWPESPYSNATFEKVSWSLSTIFIILGVIFVIIGILVGLYFCTDLFQKIQSVR